MGKSEIGSDWRKDLENTLLAGKYCWDKSGIFLSDEFYGIDDAMGWYDHVVDMVVQAEKRAYLAGFAAGVSEVIKEDETVDVVVNQITGERRYLEWR